jgi:hypothetical protein
MSWVRDRQVLFTVHVPAQQTPTFGLCALQGHTVERLAATFLPTEIGKQACLQPWCNLLPGSAAKDGSIVTELSVVMKVRSHETEGSMQSPSAAIRKETVHDHIDELLNCCRVK